MGFVKQGTTNQDDRRPAEAQETTETRLRALVVKAIEFMSNLRFDDHARAFEAALKEATVSEPAPRRNEATLSCGHSVEHAITETSCTECQAVVAPRRLDAQPLPLDLQARARDLMTMLATRHGHTLSDYDTSVILASLTDAYRAGERRRPEAQEGLERPTAAELLRQGGEWLGAARSWLQWHTRNGDQVTWGSGDLIEPQLSVRQIEDLASEVAAAAMRPQPSEQRLDNALKARWKAEAESAEFRALLDARYNGAVAAIDALFTEYEQALNGGLDGVDHVFTEGKVRAASDIREAVIMALRRAAAKSGGSDGR